MNGHNNKSQQDASNGIIRLPDCLIRRIKVISPFIINANAKIKGPIFPKKLDGSSILDLKLTYEKGITINLSVSLDGIINIDFGEQSFWVNTKVP
jgi:hypothetical protein